MMNTIKTSVGVLAILALSTGLYWPRSRPRGSAPVAAPYCLELPVLPVALDAAPKKKCEPACTAPQVCVDGTCCLPAMQHSPGSSNSFAWVEDSLR